MTFLFYLSEAQVDKGGDVDIDVENGPANGAANGNELSLSPKEKRRRTAEVVHELDTTVQQQVKNNDSFTELGRGQHGSLRRSRHE